MGARPGWQPLMARRAGQSSQPGAPGREGARWPTAEQPGGAAQRPGGITIRAAATSSGAHLELVVVELRHGVGGRLGGHGHKAGGEGRGGVKGGGAVRGLAGCVCGNSGGQAGITAGERRDGVHGGLRAHAGGSPEAAGAASLAVCGASGERSPGGGVREGRTHAAGAERGARRPRAASGWPLSRGARCRRGPRPLIRGQQATAATE